MKIQILLLSLVLFAFGCRKGDTAKDEMRDGDTTVVVTDGTDADAIDTDNPEMNDNAYADFGLSNGSATIKLRDKYANQNFSSFGTLNDTLTRKLTLTTDTHQGATVKEYKYDNINLEYFMPRGSNDAWLMAAEIKGGNWSTARGIKVGDSVADLQAMYPNATNAGDDKLQYIYTVDDSQIIFGTAGDKITRIKIIYNIP